jgi:hypothetical protein
MTTAALALYVLAIVVLFGVRSWVQDRRTGSAGFHGISGTPADAGWWGGVLFVVAMVAGVAGPRRRPHALGAAALQATGGISGTTRRCSASIGTADRPAGGTPSTVPTPGGSGRSRLPGRGRR